MSTLFFSPKPHEMVKALILDLDDTIFPTSSIDPMVVKPFFDSLEEHNDVLPGEEFEKAKLELWKRPFYVVAEKYGFSAAMVEKSLEELNKLELSLKIETFGDYPYLQEINLDRFLVTTGFTKLQKAKIEALNIAQDFIEIVIDDPSIQAGGKVMAFQYILHKYNYKPEEVLVIGDNPDSEIKAGLRLGIPVLLIERNKENQKKDNQINSFHELPLLIKKRNSQ